MEANCPLKPAQQCLDTDPQNTHPIPYRPLAKLGGRRYLTALQRLMQ